MENKYNKYPQIANSTLIKKFEQNNNKQDFYILQIGCNAGHNLKAIQDLYPKAKCYGVDILQDALREAKKNVPNGTFWLANVEEKPNLFQRDLFDYILLPDVLQHLIKPDEVLKYIKGFLKPDGRIFITIPNLMNWGIIVNLIANGRFTYTDMGLLDYDHKHLFTYHQILSMLEKTGYKINEVTSIKIQEIPEEIKDFIDILIQLSNNNIKLFEYETFSYLIVAQKVDKQ